MHPACYDGLIQELFVSQSTAIFQVGIGDIRDLWAGLNTESDEQAGITD